MSLFTFHPKKDFPKIGLLQKRVFTHLGSSYSPSSSAAAQYSPLAPESKADSKSPKLDTAAKSIVEIIAAFNFPQIPFCRTIFSQKKAKIQISYHLPLLMDNKCHKIRLSSRRILKLSIYLDGNILLGTL